MKFFRDHDDWLESLKEGIDEAISKGEDALVVTLIRRANTGELPWVICPTCLGMGGYSLQTTMERGFIVDGEEIICVNCKGHGYIEKV